MITIAQMIKHLRQAAEQSDLGVHAPIMVMQMYPSKMHLLDKTAVHIGTSGNIILVIQGDEWMDA